MFITLTIDTNKNKKLRFFKKRFDASTGWRKSIHAKKRNLWQRFFAWRRSLKRGNLSIKGRRIQTLANACVGQVAMF